MKRLIPAVTGACAIVLGQGMASADEVPDASSTEAPAMTGFGERLVLAWAGESGTQEHRVWYSTFNGTWTAAAEVPDALTTAAPALGVADNHLYLLVTPPGVNNKIYYYAANGTTFTADGLQLCDAGACAETRAKPALLGDGSTLYAAWSTANGSIGYGALSHGSWFVSTPSIPHALTNPSLGPTLALYQDKLYVAWVDPSEQVVSVATATLPLTSSSWSHEVVQLPIHTQVAPAMSVLNLVSSSNPAAEALFLSWTTVESTINFERWNPSDGQWSATNTPIPLPSGPLTSVSPALTSSTLEAADQQCFVTNSLAYTDRGTHHVFVKKTTRQNPKGCP